jgi:hypothetical protein
LTEFGTYLTGKTQVKAAVWNENGDHPLDESTFVTLGTETDGEPDVVFTEGKVVRRYRHPDISGKTVCADCGYSMYEHGWLDVGADGLVVCPGDYVVTNEEGDTYPTKPAEFEATFQLKV